jgi:tRNA pseudouridine55 synthase
MLPPTLPFQQTARFEAEASGSDPSVVAEELALQLLAVERRLEELLLCLSLRTPDQGGHSMAKQPLNRAAMQRNAIDPDSQPHGLLVVDKPRGPTSHDVVAQARRLYRTRRVGHAGTLDPMATGVLLLLFGEATKLSGHLTLEEKRYRATVQFGKSTTTLDALGEVTEERELLPGWLVESALRDAIQAEAARERQVPPSYSALKVSGQRAYRLMRQGHSVDLEPRSIRVLGASLEAWTERQAVIELNVSKGYYVRAFARDLGRSLGVPAHLTELVRLASGPFTLSEAVPWPPERALNPLPLATSVARALPSARLNSHGLRKAEWGQRLSPEDFDSDPLTLPIGATSGWYAPSGQLVALGERVDVGSFAVVRGFAAKP